MKNGLSLIILVITIIVSLILLSVVIMNYGDDNVTSKASEVAFKSNAKTYQDTLMLYISNKKLEAASQGKTYDPSSDTNLTMSNIIPNMKESDKDLYQIQNGNLVYIGTGDSAIWAASSGILVGSYLPKIPTGFSISTVNGEKTIDEGLVIIDNTNGNEFVWVPVMDFNLFSREHFGTIDQKWWSGTFVTDTVSENNMYEPKPDGITNSTEIEKMYKSVKDNKGFYVARYEAGIINVANKTIQNGTILPISKKNSEVWNSIPWGMNNNDITPGNGAVTVSRFMYNSNLDIQSHLIYGVQWDAILRWVKDIDNPNVAGSKFVQNSKGMGEYENYSNPILTGSNNNYKVKNIYDLAGNVWEWTYESYSAGRIYRGGFFGTSGVNFPSSSRGAIVASVIINQIGFRTALYIK
jgi:hypothetical protein